MKHLITLLSILLLAACSGTTGKEPQAPTPDAARLAEDAILQDAQSYADDSGISLDEALARLELQNSDAISTLQTQLQQSETGTFAGLWLQHEPQYRLVVAFTEDGQETIKKYVTPDNPLYELLEVRPADYSYVQLQADQATVLRYLDTIDQPAGTGIMMIENRVMVEVTDRAAFDEALAEAGLRLPESVVVNVVYEPLGENPPLAITPVSGVFMPQLKQRDAGFMEALIVGKLVIEDGCLRVRSENDSHLIIWQTDYFLTDNQGDLDILDEMGAVVAHVGKMIYLGGGEQRVVDDGELLQAIPATCGGPYWRMGEFVPAEYIPKLVSDLPVEASSTAGWPLVNLPGASLTVAYPDGWFVHEAGKAVQITPNAQPTWSSYFDPAEPHGGPTFDLLYNLNRQVAATPLAEVEHIVDSFGAELEPLRPSAPMPERPDIIVGVYRFVNEEEQMALLVGAVTNPAAAYAQPVIAMTSVSPIGELPEVQPIFEAVLASLRPDSPPRS